MQIQNREARQEVCDLRELGLSILHTPFNGRWASFVAVADALVALVRGGSVDRHEAGTALREWSAEYFDLTDERTAWLTNAVLLAFAHATCPRRRGAA